MARGHAFWLTNRIANPVLRRLLRTPLGRGLGRSLAVLRYTGRRTGRTYELVCQYARDGDRVWILVGQADRKTWWRNLSTPSPVELWLAGRRHSATAVAVTGSQDTEECVRGLRAYLAAVPRAVASLGLADADDRAGMSTLVPRTVLVRADVREDGSI
jgi:hypothetical protein